MARHNQEHLINPQLGHGIPKQQTEGWFECSQPLHGHHFCCSAGKGAQRFSVQQKEISLVGGGGSPRKASKGWSIILIGDEKKSPRRSRMKAKSLSHHKQLLVLHPVFCLQQQAHQESIPDVIKQSKPGDRVHHMPRAGEGSRGQGGIKVWAGLI